MIFIPGMHFRSLSAALSFPQLRGKWILLLPLGLCSTRLMIHGVHLLTWAGPAFIWVMLLNHVKVLTGRAAWLMRNWELGHGTSCQLWSSHTRPQHAALSLADHIKTTLWLVVGRFSGKAWSRQTQGITRNTTNIVNSRQWGRGTRGWHGALMTMRAQTQTSLCGPGLSSEGGIAKSHNNCNHISRRSSGARGETDCTHLMWAEQIPQ